MRWLAKRLPAALLLAALVSGAVADDYAAGEAAWQRGEYTAAIALWQPLADDGHPRAQFALGIAYERGQGVVPSAATAARWYRRAAARGLADAEYNLALLYLDGRGVEQDLKQTVRLFRAAAERGHLPAQVNLAYSYEQGSGVAQDRSVAAAWYARAAMAGNREAWRRFTDLREAGVRPAVLPALSEAPPEPVVEAPAPASPARRDGAMGEDTVTEAPVAEAATGEPTSPAGAADLAGSYRLRLAAYRESANAERGWRTLLARHGAVLAGLQHELVPVVLGERGRFLRLEAGPFASLAAARAACEAIRDRGDDCLALAPARAGASDDAVQ
ncbi:MAG: tetratricopeptide repeat protein [Pseudohaliea sp.]